MSTETESKTYVFGNDGGNLASILAPMLQQRGFDPNLLMAMNNNGFGGNNGWFFWIIILLFIWNRNGWGNYDNGGIANQINNDYGRDLLMQAINGNRTAISELASTLNCDVNSINAGINSVMSSVQSVGNQVGMSSQAIVNAVQSGNASISSQIAQCCCDNKQLVITQGYENRLANQEQTAILAGKIDAQTTFLSDKFCQLEKRELESKIDSLRDANSTLKNQISNLNQNAVFGQMISGATAPIAASVNALQGEVNDIKCKLPQTITLPANQGTYLSPCQATILGLNGFGLNGFYNNGQIWG